MTISRFIWLAVALTIAVAVCSAPPMMTSTPAPSATPVPASTAAPYAVPPVTVALTPTLVPAVTAAVTAAIMATPTPTAAATSTPSPTLELIAPTMQPTKQAPATTLASPETPASSQLISARWHQLIGDCATARKELAALLAGAPNPAEASEARFRMAQCYLRDDADAEAAVVLADLLAAAAPADLYRGPATFLLGEVLAAQERWAMPRPHTGPICRWPRRSPT